MASERRPEQRSTTTMARPAKGGAVEDDGRASSRSRIRQKASPSPMSTSHPRTPRRPIPPGRSPSPARSWMPPAAPWPPAADPTLVERAKQVETLENQSRVTSNVSRTAVSLSGFRTM
jgi:hypothetical protein